MKIGLFYKLYNNAVYCMACLRNENCRVGTKMAEAQLCFPMFCFFILSFLLFIAFIIFNNC